MLKHRLISGTLLVLVLIAVAISNIYPLHLAVILALCALGSYEFYALLEGMGLPSLRLAGSLFGVTLPGAAWVMSRAAHRGVEVSPEWTLLLLGGIAVATLVAVLFISDLSRKPALCWAGTLTGLFYVPLFFTFLILILVDWHEGYGKLAVLYMIAVVKCTDIGAYFVGSAIGKTKLIPRLSPAKTWEGCAGGIGFAIVASLVFFFATGGELGPVRLTWVHALILPVLLGVTGILGDLAESLFKRSAQIKDSGSLVAGMGGVLDILDSILLASPVFYFYLKVLTAS